MNQQPRILYVEDDPKSRRVMKMLLVNRMHLNEVTFFEDSYDFSRRISELHPRPDLIFLDIHVEPYDGFEMLRLLRQMDDFREVPVIALTASVMNEEVAQLKSAGFNGCIAKPINSDLFPDMLVAILQGERIWHIA